MTSHSPVSKVKYSDELDRGEGVRGVWDAKKNREYGLQGTRRNVERRVQIRRTTTDDSKTNALPFRRGSWPDGRTVDFSRGKP